MRLLWRSSTWKMATKYYCASVERIVGQNCVVRSRVRRRRRRFPSENAWNIEWIRNKLPFSGRWALPRMISSLLWQCFIGSREALSLCEQPRHGTLINLHSLSARNSCAEVNRLQSWLRHEGNLHSKLTRACCSLRRLVENFWCSLGRGGKPYFTFLNYKNLFWFRFRCLISKFKLILFWL